MNVLQKHTKARTKKRIWVKKGLACILSVVLVAEIMVCSLGKGILARAETEGMTKEKDLPVTAEAAVLMEQDTQTIIGAKNATVQRPIASVTKVMTLLLIMDAVSEGSIQLTDTVTVSEHAASMGGSQVFFEPGETQTVETMIKCISISSANDACVAMAEHLAGSEEAFVAKMNEKAKNLGMEYTTFLNCCGLDTAGHVSCAKDVAIMSAELMKNHPDIQKYTTTWMDTIVHNTKRGASEFGLANTNKLLKQYNGITGLKTGSTNEAKYCLSATAERNGVKLIAVILGAPDTKTRFREAAALLDLGFATCKVYHDEGSDLTLPDVTVKNAMKNSVSVAFKEPFSYVFFNGENTGDVKRKIVLKDSVKAPLKKGDILGECRYEVNGKLLGSVELVCTEDRKEMTLGDGFMACKNMFFQKK